MRYITCTKCGKIHTDNYKCSFGVQYNGGNERKLRSKWAWTEKSREIREDANHLCEVCRDQGIYTYDGLSVHHIVKVKDDESKLLDNYNLICLCEEHHTLADNGKLDKDYLIKLAKERENRQAYLSSR